MGSLEVVFEIEVRIADGDGGIYAVGKFAN